MSRPGRYTPDNPWQRATALGKRLRVKQGGPALGATWEHPDLPLTYLLTPNGAWALLEQEGPAMHTRAAGVMAPTAAALHLERARMADPRRLAAAAMLRHLESAPA